VKILVLTCYELSKIWQLREKENINGFFQPHKIHKTSNLYILLPFE